MEEVKSYNITEKEFKMLEKSADYVHNISIVLDFFVSNQREYEELYNITPIVKYLRNQADILNAFFINLGGGSEEENL